MRVVLPVLAILSVLAVPAGSAGSVVLNFHGTDDVYLMAAEDPVLWMDESPPSGTDRFAVGHAGDGAIETPITFVLQDGFTDDLLLGDGDPETTGMKTDFVTANVCMGEFANSAFVPRVVFSIHAGDVLLGSRLNNDLGIPYQVPNCISVNVPLNQAVDDQTPDNDVADLGLPLAASGDYLLAAGTPLKVTVLPVTPFAAAWSLAFDSDAYPSGAEVHFSARGADVGAFLASLSGDAPAAGAASLFENLTTPSFLHEFTNATSDDYTLNFTVPWQNVTIRQTAAVTAGSANVTVLRDGEVYLSLLLTNQTAPAVKDDGNGTADSNGTELPVLTDAAGNWSVVIDYEGFVGSVGMELAEHVPAAPPVVETNTTKEPVLDADVGEDSPGPALPLLVLGLLATVAVRRRR